MAEQPPDRVARFFLVNDTKTGKLCIPNEHKMYQIVIKYPKLSVKYSKWPQTISTVSRLRPSKIFPNWDFWFENNKRSGNPAAGVDVSLFIDVPFCNPAL
jgi:hypothetical protein